MHDVRVRNLMGKEWLSKVKKTCPEVKWLAHYALLGPYDFMDVYEAPDVDTAHRCPSSRARKERSAPRAGPPCLTRIT